MVQLENSDFYLGYYEDGLIRLIWDNNIIEDFEPFNPINSLGKFIVFNDVTNVYWEKGDINTGIMFDATGSGSFYHPDNYTILNDFYIADVGGDYVTIQPCMITQLSVGQTLKIRGQNYLPISIDIKNRNFNLIPVDTQVLINHNIPLAEIQVLLKNDNKHVRLRAVKELGNVQKTEVIPHLLNSLLDEDFFVRIEAAQSLGKLSKKRDVYENVKQYLLSFIQDSSPSESENLMNAIVSNPELSDIARGLIISDISIPGPVKQEFNSVEEMEKKDKIIDKCPKYGGRCGRPIEISKKYSEKNVFVAIPYARYKQHEEIIRDVVTSFSFNPIVLKDIPMSADIFCKICYQIQISEYGIVDISRGLRNIDFELGLLQGRGKQTAILLRKNSKQEKFSDIYGIEKQIYKDPAEFRKKLEEWLVNNTSI